MLEIGIWLKEIFGAWAPEGVIHHSGKRGSRVDERHSAVSWIVNSLASGRFRPALPAPSRMLLIYREAMAAELGYIVFQGANAASPLGELG